MQHLDDIANGTAFPGVDLALWVRLIVTTLVVIIAGAWAITAL